MKKLLSLFLVLVTLLGILPTAAFAADRRATVRMVPSAGFITAL